jgi:ElaB/YqjD/DUF883 family membrane-anchored ribosome-binding protein
MATTPSSMTDLSNTASRMAHDAKDTISRNVESAAHSAEGAAASAKHVAGVQMERVEHMIRANPIAATGIAAGVGFVVALLARRA